MLTPDAAPSTPTTATTASYPGVRLTSTKAAELLPDNTTLTLEDYLRQTPKLPPVTVEATHTQVADECEKVFKGRLIRTMDKTWMHWRGGTWGSGNDETAENAVKRLISSGDTPRKVIPYTTRKATNADKPGLLASGLVEVRDDDVLVWKATKAPVTHIPVPDDKWANTAVNIQGVRRTLAGSLQRDVEFDADPTVLNCGGVVLGFHAEDPARPITQRELRPEDFITKSTSARYVEDATCPEFEKAISEILPDPEMRRFFQMSIGLSLSGVVRDHVFFVMRGRGRNGKTMLLEIFAEVLGDYGVIFPSSLIEEAHGEQHPTELMDLKGCRLAAVSETEQGKRWNTNRIKRLAGGDTLKARAMHKDYEPISATHTLWVASNNRPSLSDPDPALWERYREIPCPTQWHAPGARPEDRVGKKGEADLGLQLRLLASESEGILRWAVRGYEMYAQNGFKLFIPADVQQAIDEARKNATPFSVFAREAFERGPDSEFIIQQDAMAAWKAYLKSESMLSIARPSRTSDLGEYLAREFTFANPQPRLNGRDHAKVFGLRWTEVGRAWASLQDTTSKPVTATRDGNVVQLPFNTSKGQVS